MSLEELEAGHSWLWMENREEGLLSLKLMSNCSLVERECGQA